MLHRGSMFQDSGGMPTFFRIRYMLTMNFALFYIKKNLTTVLNAENVRGLF